MAILLNVFGDYLTTFLVGPPGSGKTTATRVLRALTDPNEIDTRRAASVRDLERFPVGMNRDSQAGWKRRFLWGDSSFRSTRWASLIHWICVPELLRR